MSVMPSEPGEGKEEGEMGGGGRKEEGREGGRGERRGEGWRREEGRERVEGREKEGKVGTTESLRYRSLELVSRGLLISTYSINELRNLVVI